MVKETGSYNLPVIGIAAMVAISAVLFAFLNPDRPLVSDESNTLSST